MKIRTGFVSNSSSSSFIAFGNIIDVCDAMIQTMIEKDSSDDELCDYKDLVDALDKCRKNPDVISGKYGLSFECGGYDVKLHFHNNSVYVYTANYYDWGDKIIIQEHSDGDFDGIFENQLYVWLPELIVYKNVPEYTYKLNIHCPVCKERCTKTYRDENNDLICGECKKGIIKG